MVAVVLVQGRDDLPEPAPVEHVPLPTSIAAIGDSITAGVGAAPDEFGASPDHVWSTGDADDEVESHYERLLAAGAEIQERNDNFAFSGADMADGPEQARHVVASRASYVTILLGANDVCTSSIETMTPVADFERDFRDTLDILAQGLPAARFFVVSIPDVHRLWETFKDDPVAVRVWEGAGPCGAMLDPANGDEQREAARQRNIAFNEVLEAVCDEEPRCRHDQQAIFDYDFGSDSVALDYFHPSHQGHEILAEVTWRYGYWPDL